eukprot:TRINITY_DN8024_c0_g1_i1.p1 TRINITY_DN8024_c0_g1~~TRINITY_DN8024_c0_g1_i1.p1  ORF type:complete len:201 (-),score=48.79 TRINITY_DN8024_c0_g1_i1:61-663(-)
MALVTELPSQAVACLTSSGSSPCEWCAGLGLDLMTGDPCSGCNGEFVPDSGAASAGYPESGSRRSRRARRSCADQAEGESASCEKVSVSAFFSDVATSGLRPRKKCMPLQMMDITSGEDQAQPATVARIPSPCRSRRNGPKVKFDLEEVLEFPITPYSEVYGMHPRFLQYEDFENFSSDSTTEEDEEEESGQEDNTLSSS